MKNIIAVIFGILVCIALVLSVELFLHAFWSKEDSIEMKYAEEYFFIDSNGVTKAIPNGRYPTSSTVKTTGRKIYDVTYSIDHLSRRVTPYKPEMKNKNFLLFFGGSFTFGEGLEDIETIPYFTGQYSKNHTPYNYGFHGHSAAEMLIKLQTETIPEEIEQDRGILIYTFMDAHIIRVVGSMRVVTTWGKNRPYFYLDDSDAIQRNGDFESGRPGLMLFYSLLAKSSILELLNLDIPNKIEDKHFYLFTRIVEEALTSYKKQFPESDFYLLIYPGSQYASLLKGFLDKRKIPYLDYSKLFNRSDPKYFIAPEDLHPNAYSNQIVSEKIARDLGLD
ncbi:MAG: hypothetical protein ACW991_09010 [Candidatus Hodarchaeales archaeon]